MKNNYLFIPFSVYLFDETKRKKNIMKFRICIKIVIIMGPFSIKITDALIKCFLYFILFSVKGEWCGFLVKHI